MDDARLFGRNADGTKEILNKSGRLTQSERLVLIVIAEPVSVDRLLLTLPSLSPDRVRRGVQRLLELGLIYELLLAPDGDVAPEPAEPIPVSAAQSFLRQHEADPVSQVVTGDELGTTMRMQAFQDSVWAPYVPGASRSEAVPLSSVFRAKQPEAPAMHVPVDELEDIARARIRADISARRSRREQRDRAEAEARIRELEASVGQSLGNSVYSAGRGFREPARVRHMVPSRRRRHLPTGAILLLLALVALFGGVSALVSMLHL